MALSIMLQNVLPFESVDETLKCILTIQLNERERELLFRGTVHDAIQRGSSTLEQDFNRLSTQQHYRSHENIIRWSSPSQHLVAPKGAVFVLAPSYAFAFFSVFLGRSTAWMLGRTPPCAMVTPASSLFNSSSLRTAS